jgi:hypothetical protein
MDDLVGDVGNPWMPISTQKSKGVRYTPSKQPWVDVRNFDQQETKH